MYNLTFYLLFSTFQCFFFYDDNHMLIKKNKSNCWICRRLPCSSTSGLPWCMYTPIIGIWLVRLGDFILEGNYSRTPYFLCPWDSPGKNMECVATPSSRGSSQPRDQTQVSCIGGRFFTVRATREAHTYIETVNRARIISLVVSGNLWNQLMVLTIKLNF